MTAGVGESAARPRWAPDWFAFGALGVHLAMAWQLRVVAWPEVTTPGYLIARGLLLYRDIKFVHTPGLMELLAAAFSTLGVNADTLRFFAILWPLAAHAALLRETRTYGPGARFWTSAFFLSMFYAWRGNSVWPSVAMAALAIPIANALGRGRLRCAGLWIGAAILLKQTAALLLAAVLLRFAIARRPFPAIPRLVIWASLPYAAAGLAFAAAGGGRDFVRWTLVIPFQLSSEILLAPTPFFVGMVVAAFLPTLFEALLEKPGDYEVPVRWHLLVAVGLVFVAYPRFHPMECVACLPCLAVGASRLLRRRARPLHALAVALVVALTIPTAFPLAAGERFDGKVVFWDDDPSIEVLVARLRSLPPDTTLLLDLWPNVLPRAGLLPPGRLYVHPWLPYLFEFDRVAERITRAARRPGTAVVGFRGENTRGERAGPYVIQVR